MSATMVVAEDRTQAGGRTALRSQARNQHRAIDSTERMASLTDGRADHHTDGDAAWVVVGGEVTFYGENDDVLAKAGRGELVVMPRNTMYWFENSGTDPSREIALTPSTCGSAAG